MDTTTLKERQSLQEDVIFEDDAQEQDEGGMTDEELKVESLKIATNIGKLMSNVTPDDIVNIAETVAKFIKGGSSASLETTTADTEENFDTTEEETSEETTEETPAENEAENEAESEEDFEV